MKTDLARQLYTKKKDWSACHKYYRNDHCVDVQKAKLLKQKKEEGNTAFKNSQLEEAYKLYR